MDFQLTSEQKRLQHKCRELAADFASRSGLHDRDASHPVENYDRLAQGRVPGAVAQQGMGWPGRKLFRSHNRLRSAWRGLPVDGSRVQHACFGRHAAVGEHRGCGQDQAAHPEGIVAQCLDDAYDPRIRWLKVKNPDYSQKEGRGDLFNRSQRAVQSVG